MRRERNPQSLHGEGDRKRNIGVKRVRLQKSNTLEKGREGPIESQ